MKKILSLLLTLTVAFTMAVPAFAANVQPVADVTYFNEYDYILTLQQSTPEELSGIGLTQEEANEIAALFEDSLKELATLPEETLVGQGYTQDEIAALRAYNNNATLSVETMRGITGTCTGKITSTFLSPTKCTFKYSWSWDHAPIMKFNDSAAVRWLAFDSQGYSVDVTKTSDTCNIDYYWGDTYKFSRSGSEEPDLDFNSINIQFSVTELFQSGTTLTEEAYAKNGYIKITVEVEPEVSNSISYLKVAGLCGHTTIGGAFPSISLSPAGSISIGFSGNVSIDPVGSAKVKISGGNLYSAPIVSDI